MLATHGMPKELALVFAALERQSHSDLEVILCEDGEDPENLKVVERFRSRGKLKLIHLKQEHKGFRKCRILNQGILRAQGDLLIFLDGDCVPHRHFVLDHARHYRPGTYLAGRRVDLGETISKQTDESRINQGFFDRPSLRWLTYALMGESDKPNRTLRIQTPWLRKILGLDRVPDLKGCNFSVSREDMLKINGFDESYEGYGREDTDVELRLKNMGLQICSLRGLALQFHMWHPRRDFTPQNEDLLESVKTEKRVKAIKGISEARI